jgi:hypothetical protein
VSRQIVGDPLTGSLPVTRLIATSRPERQSWPIIPDRDPVAKIDLGDVVKVRTWRGVREYRVRLVLRSRGRRRYLIGQSRRGWLHHAWLSNVISSRPWTGC